MQEDIERGTAASSPTTYWGLFVFGLGIVMLVGVFILSYLLFSNAAETLAAVDKANPSTLQPISRFLAANAVRLGFLVVMGYISSLIANKGISLFMTRQGVKPE